jgi:hypothetical protein
MTRTLAAIQSDPIVEKHRMREIMALLQSQVSPSKTLGRSKIVGMNCKSRLCPSQCSLTSARLLSKPC